MLQDEIGFYLCFELELVSNGYIDRKSGPPEGPAPAVHIFQFARFLYARELRKSIISGSMSGKIILSADVPLPNFSDVIASIDILR